jgi:hypothetical protein
MRRPFVSVLRTSDDLFEIQYVDGFASYPIVRRRFEEIDERIQRAMGTLQLAGGSLEIPGLGRYEFPDAWYLLVR